MNLRYAIRSALFFLTMAVAITAVVLTQSLPLMAGVALLAYVFANNGQEGTAPYSIPLAALGSYLISLGIGTYAAGALADASYTIVVVLSTVACAKVGSALHRELEAQRAVE